MGFGPFSSSKSANTANNTTNNFDNRVVADGGSIGLSGGTGSSFNVMDGGITSRALDSIDKTFQLISDSGAAGLSSILSLQKTMFEKSTDQATTMAGTVEKNVLEAYRNAASDATNTIDNKTIIALAVAAVVGFGFIYMRKKS